MGRRAIVPGLGVLSVIACSTQALAGEWLLQRGADSFTDQEMVVATRTFATPEFTGGASIACTGGKKLTYGVKIDKAFGKTNVYINRGIDPLGAGAAIETGGLIGYAGPVATVDVRTDGSEIKQLYIPIRFSNAVTLSSPDFRTDLDSWIDEVGQQIAYVRLGKSKSISTPEGIADLAAANRLRMRLHLINGDIIFDLNQREPEPTAVLAMCGLARLALTKALNAKAAEKMESELKFERQQRQVGQPQSDQENEGQSVLNEGSYLP